MITFFQWKEYKQSLTSNMSSVAKITSENIQASVMFNNSNDADKILIEFSNDPRIISAGIYLLNGTLFSAYHSTNERLPDIYDLKNNNVLHEFKNNKLHVFQPISIQGKDNVIGTLYIISNLDLLYQQISNNIIVTTLIVLLVLILAIILTTRMQKMISQPILSLSGTTNKIKNEKDYSVRVEHDEYLEIEELSDGFNSMLEEIQHRDQHLQRMATYDVLTDLPNRKYFIDILNQAIARGSRKTQRHAVLYMDLDRFKYVNDSLGHSVGDELLIQVAKRMRIAIRTDDIVARFGGDEFTFLLRDIPSTNQAAEISERILEVLSEPFDMHNHSVVVDPSIGIVIYPENGMTPEDLLRNADTAMYRAKNTGGKKYLFFTEAMNEEAQIRLELEEALRYALNKHEFILHYQPEIDMQTGKMIGMEALVRWNRNGAGLVAPNLFIPIAEETGLIIPLGIEILKQAIHETKKLINVCSYDCKVAVNISAKQFKQENLIEKIKSILEECELPPEDLELEITEAAVIDNTKEAIAILKKIKDTGITLAMDDFGTGYSSLNYLKKFPIDKLKIDKSFIRDMEQSEENKSIVKYTIDLAHILKLTVVAEGVETEHQANILRDMECDIAQGYLYSRPLDISHISDFFRTRH
jgi:diguanylate cyclase (GGDEF)-like protein